MSGHRRGSFRGRKRFFRDTFAPGGSKTDPLNIEIELSENPELEKERLGLLNPTPDRKRRKTEKKEQKAEKERVEREKEEKEQKTPQLSPVKVEKHGNSWENLIFIDFPENSRRIPEKIDSKASVVERREGCSGVP